MTATMAKAARVRRRLFVNGREAPVWVSAEGLCQSKISGPRIDLFG